MKKRIYLNKLYDYYKELFTEKQRLYFEAYYWDNLSLSEIAENNEVSRNAVFNQLKIIEEKLSYYEEKLKLEDKKNKIIKSLGDNEELLNKIKGII